VESHCPGLGPISEWDLEETRKMKEKIFELVKQWLGIETVEISEK
jgi:hypothetical protein